MKTILFARTPGSFLVLGILNLSCVSAITLRASSDIATDYIRENTNGKTTSYYSNPNVALSATPDTFQLGDSPEGENLLQFGLGGGVCLKGSNWALEYSLIKPSNWGASLSFNSNINKSDNIPSDWADGGRTIYPKDYLSTLSLSLLRAFSTSRESVRFGIEAGPSWVRYSIAQMEPNPGYDSDPDPDGNWIDKIGTVYKYDKSHLRTNSVGLSIVGKMELLTGRHTGFSISAFTNINNLKSVAGLNVCFIFGMLKPGL